MSGLIQEVWAVSGIFGLLVLAAVFILGIYLKRASNKSSEKTSSVLVEGFKSLSIDMSKHNDKLLDALLTQNQNNTRAILDVVNVALVNHRQQNKNIHDRNLKLRETASLKIKTKIHDLLNRYNCDRSFILEFHNSKQNMTGLSFLWYDMTFEEIAKGVPTIQTYWKDQEASTLLPVVKDICDEDGFKIYTIEDLEELQHKSTVLYHRLRIERQLQEAIMIALYGSNNEIIGILILEYEYSTIPVEVLDVADLIREAGSISDLLDYQKLETENVVDNVQED